MDSLHFSFILVNYRSAALIRLWLISLHALDIDPTSYEVCIVNNDSSETDLLDALSTEFSVRVLHLPKNVGFGAAVNRGAEQTRGEFLFLCNPDTQFVSGDFDTLRQLFREQPRLGIVGVQLLDAHRQTERFSVGKHFSLWLLLRNHSPWKEIPPTREHAVERVSGGGLCIRKETFLAIGGFDERFFLYFEDADLCQRTRNSGYSILFSPVVRLLHQGGASMPSKGQQKEWYRQSRSLYFRIHRSAREQRLLRLFSAVFE